jgi:large subunit ribosomal protein L29
MKANDIREIREKTVAELDDELKALKSELFKLRFQHATNQLDNPLKLRSVKRDIARVKTIQREIELKGAK